MLLLPKIFDLLHHKSDGTSIIIVISPLTSLMKDQVAMCCSHNVSAVKVTREEDSKKHYEGVISGKFQIVYISPEMIIGTNKWRSTLQEEKYQSRLCGIIVDEAHCVKKWYVYMYIYRPFTRTWAKEFLMIFIRNLTRNDRAPLWERMYGAVWGSKAFLYV